MSIETLRPNGIGWTTFACQGDSPNWKCVDEVISDDKATYVYTGDLTGLTDTYLLPDHSAVGGAINYVKVYFRISAYAEGSGRAAIHIHPTFYYGAWHVAPDLGKDEWETFSEQWDISPFTGLPWTWDEIDTLQAGVSLKNPIGVGTCCTQVYVEVDYISIPTVTTDPATNIKALLATLNGTLVDDGGYTGVLCGFEYGLDDTYGTTTPTEVKTTGETFSQSIAGLLPNRTYHFRAFADNKTTTYGSDRTFTTRLGGNPNIDQLIYQHVERMTR